MKSLLVCRVCGLTASNEVELELFAKCKGKKYDRRNICKKCLNARARKRHADHPEKRREYLKKYREANREKLREYNKKWSEANPEKVKEKTRKYRRTHPEKVKESIRKWREANSEKYKKQLRKYREDNHLEISMKKAYSRARKNGLDFDLDLEYLEQLFAECDGICSMTGIKMLYNAGYNNPYSMSIDRIVPESGYVKGNIRLISRWYNTARSNLGDDFTFDMCQRVVEMVGSR
jgi:hypothetical protein